MKNFVTANRLRAIPLASLEAASKNPVISVIDTPTKQQQQQQQQQQKNNLNNFSSSTSATVKARNVFEFALVHDILKRDPFWMEKIRIFRNFNLRLPSGQMSRKLPNDIITYENNNYNNTNSPQLPQNWWLHFAPFIHPSYWDNLAQRSLHDQAQGMKLLVTASFPTDDNNNKRERKQIDAAAEEILTTLQDELPLLKNQFSMVPLQNIGDSVISLALSTLDFTIIPPTQAVASGNDDTNNDSKSTPEELELRHRKMQRAHRRNVKQGLQDAEFICRNIVARPRRKVERIVSKKNEKRKTEMITIPSWSDDLLLLKDNINERRNQNFNLLARPQEDDEYRVMKDEACVGSFIALLGSISVEFGVENAAKIMWRLAEEGQEETKKK